MQTEDWENPSLSFLGCLLHEPPSNTLLILMNAELEDVAFHLPKTGMEGTWVPVVVTGIGKKDSPDEDFSQEFPLQNRSLAVLEWQGKTA